MPTTFFSWKDNTLELKVVIQPNANQDEIVGLYNGRLKIRLKVPPVDGKANNHLIKYLSKHFKQPKSSISILKGTTNRQKTLQLSAMLTMPDSLLNLMV